MVFIIKRIEATDSASLNLSLEMNQNLVNVNLNHHSMTAIISQLGALAQYSNLVFSRLITEATGTYQRINKLSGRLVNLAEDMKEVEKYMQTTTLDTMLSTSRAAFSSEPALQDQLFTRESLPEGVKQMYDKAAPPPNLASLDSYMEGGGSALKLYTNPNFFIEEWIAEQLKIREEALKEKKKRRAERKKQREAKKAQMKAREEQQIQVTQIQVAKYDPVTGEKIFVTTQVKGSSLGIAQASFRGAQTPLGFGDFDSSEAPPPPPEDEFPLPPPEDIPLPPPEDIPLPPPEDIPLPPPERKHAPAPPVVTPSSNVPTPPPPAIIAQTFSPMTPLPSVCLVPPPLPQSQNKPSPSSSFSSPSNVPVPPPIPMNIPDAPLPPPITGIPAPVTDGGLQSALQKRGALKPTEPPKAKAVDARSSLLENIKNRNIALKSAKDRQLAEKKEDSTATSVASILSRRIAIIGESESEGSGSEAEEWDD